MAAARAPANARIVQPTVAQVGSLSVARRSPESANGSAKTVCSSLIISDHSRAWLSGPAGAAGEVAAGEVAGASAGLADSGVSMTATDVTAGAVAGAGARCACSGPARFASRRSTGDSFGICWFISVPISIWSSSISGDSFSSVYDARDASCHSRKTRPLAPLQQLTNGLRCWRSLKFPS
jgi:hypothetical protein